MMMMMMMMLYWPVHEDYFVFMCAAVFILCLPVVILVLQNHLALILVPSNGIDSDDNDIDNDNSECIVESESETNDRCVMNETKKSPQEKIPSLKLAMSSSLSSSSPLKSGTPRHKGDNTTLDTYDFEDIVEQKNVDNHIQFRHSFDCNSNDNGDDNDDDDSNASGISALTIKENLAMTTSPIPNTQIHVSNNKNSKRRSSSRRKNHLIIRKFRNLWKATTNNSIRRKKKNNQQIYDEEKEYNDDDGDTTCISISRRNANINSNINNSINERLSSSSCLILLMEPTSRTFEIISIQYYPGISTVSSILEEIPLQSTFNFRLRFTSYIGLLGVGMTVVTKVKNEETKNKMGEVASTITKCSHVHQLLQSKPVSKQYSCEYQYQQQQLLKEEQQLQKQQNKKYFIMPLVAILPDKCNKGSSGSTIHNKNSSSIIETTKRMACELMTDPKIGLRIQYLQQQIVVNKQPSSSSSSSSGTLN